MKPELSIIVPALNEEENLTETVGSLETLIESRMLNAEILIVDDASTDNTLAEAQNLAKEYKNVKALHKGLPRGLGTGIRFAIQHARGKAAVVMMADNVDPIEAIPEFRNKIIKEGYHLVLLSRRTNPSDTMNIPFSYRFYQRIFRILSRLLLGVTILDITYAFRAFDLSFIRNLVLTSHGFDISPEITFRTWFAGGRICEIPGRQGRRIRGVSKFLFTKAFLEYGSVLVRAFVLRLTARWLA